MVDLTPYKAAIEAARSTSVRACADPRSVFMDILHSAGITPPRALQIGKIDRVDGSEDKAGKKSAWYVYNEIEDNQNEGAIIGIASYGDWKTGLSETWVSRSEHQMSGTERANYHAKREAMKQEQEAETRAKQNEAAKVAYEIWSKAKPAKTHPYLTKKSVETSDGLKIADDGRLIIPVAINKQITSLQFIDDDGNKRFLTGGKLKSGWFMIEGENDVIYISEGYSTARSIFEATGKTTYAAFNAGNIYEVASDVRNMHSQSRIIIAGDDDSETSGNIGRTKAEQAASGLGIECIFPTGFNDFNDLHHEKGIGAVKKLLSIDSNIQAYEPKAKNKEGYTRPSGVLGDIVDYYHATSGNRQEGFAIQTALAICSVILGRSFKTSLENFSPLYLLNVGKSSTGKEHAKTVTEKILHQSGLGHLIAGDGYTSAGAVFSTLLDRPKHISVIDEFGRYLEAGRDLKGGNAHQREANTKLMEAISRSHSVIRPPSYSSMTLKKDAADAIKNRYAHNPSITMLTMTTPSTLFKSLDMGAISDGFFNRFIVSISDAERDVRKHKPPIEVPERINNWVSQIIARNDKIHIATEPAEPVVLEFSKEAYDMQVKFQEYATVNLPNKLEQHGMSELSGRSNEMAMKMSLICALSRDPQAKVIEGHDMEWSINYVRHCLDKTVAALKITLSHSEHESHKKEILADLRERGKDGITWSQMQKTPPYSQHKKRDLKEILESLQDADLAAGEQYQPPTGRPTIKWIALK